MIGPDATVTLDRAGRMTADRQLVVYPENSASDRLGGLVHSQRVLIALTQKGMAREDAYCMVQRHAMPSGSKGDFLALLKADPEV
jgi:adenylosuccinate lyase